MYGLRKISIRGGFGKTVGGGMCVYLSCLFLNFVSPRGNPQDTCPARRLSPDALGAMLVLSPDGRSEAAETLERFCTAMDDNDTGVLATIEQRVLGDSYGDSFKRLFVPNFPGLGLGAREDWRQLRKADKEHDGAW